MRDWKDDFIQWWKGEKQLLPYGGFGLNKIKGGRSLWEILNKIEQIIKQVEDKVRGEERLKISRLISKISKEVEDKRSSLAIVWLNMELSSRLAREYLKDSKEDKLVSNCCGAEYEYKEHYYDNHRGAFVCHRCGKICTVING